MENIQSAGDNATTEVEELLDDLAADIDDVLADAETSLEGLLETVRQAARRLETLVEGADDVPSDHDRLTEWQETVGSVRDQVESAAYELSCAREHGYRLLSWY